MISAPLLRAVNRLGRCGVLSVALRDAMARSLEPPRGQFAERPSLPEGEPVAEFLLPLSVCVPRNRCRKAQAWQESQRRAELARIMGAQWRLQQRHVTARLPLPGRPVVAALRVSTVQPDVGANWAKQAIDLLVVRRVTGKRTYGLLGVITDDRPATCRQLHWWEQGKRGKGYVWIRIWNDETTRREPES